MGGLLVLWLNCSGCADSALQVGHAHEAQNAAGTDNASARAEEENLAPALPLQAGQKSSPPAAHDDDLSPPAAAGTGMIGGLRNLIQSTEIFSQDGDVQNGLLGQLDQASETLSRVRASNRDAIRQANRQTRVGQGPRSPNVILILMERLPPFRRKDISQEAAPHLARFLDESVSLTQSYAASSDLDIARWSLMTGQNPAIVSPSFPDGRVLPGRQTLAARLWDGGYHTGFIGQWNVPSLPMENGFEEWIGFRSRPEASSFPDHVLIDTTEMHLPANANGQRKLLCDHLFVAESVYFMQRNQRSRRPFFLMLSLPDVARPANPDVSEIPMVTLDHVLEKLMETLDSLQLRQNTCVILTAESGMGSDSEQGLEEQSSAGFRTFSHGLGEGNLRVPCFVSWPGQLSPGRSDHVCAAWDLLPTLMELTATFRGPVPSDGISYVAAMHSLPQKEHPLLYWATPNHAAQAVRKGTWKGLAIQGQPGVQLYDLSSDPGETLNVAKDHPDVVQELLAR